MSHKQEFMQTAVLLGVKNLPLEYFLPRLLVVSVVYSYNVSHILLLNISLFPPPSSSSKLLTQST